MSIRRWCVRGGNASQFDGTPQAGRNCGVAVTIDMIRFASHGLIRPGSPEVRRRMANPDGWTTPSDMKRAIASYDGRMRGLGYRPARYRMAGTLANGLYVKGATRANLVARIKRLEMVHVVADYAEVNDSFTSLSGSPEFRGRHALWVGGGTKKRPGWRMRRGRLEVRMADPTWGRPGTPPKPPRWVPFTTIWKIVDGAWSSRGGRGWVGGSVACSPLLPKNQKPKPKPDSEPVDPCEDVVADLEARLDEAQEQLAEAERVLDELRARIPDAELIDMLRELRDDIDGLLPVITDTTPVEAGQEVPE